MEDPPYDKRIPELLSLKQVAAMLEFTKPGVLRAVARRELIGRRLDGAWYFRPAAVEPLAARVKAEREAKAARATHTTTEETP